MSRQRGERPQPALAEFVALVALQFSLVALSIDAMLPALPAIGAQLRAGAGNQVQLVVSSLFIGLAVGQLLYGPLSDSVGRKPAIYAGLVVFVLGCFLSMSARSFEIMLVGRVLQGLGAAGPRIVTLAMVRDLHAGAAMARVMSIAMACFILVPALAPAVGQGILLFAPWRAIFALFVLLALISFAWLHWRQPETLPPSKRRMFRASVVAGGLLEVLRNGVCMRFTAATGALFGAFLGYLNSAQAIFQDLYGLGQQFPLYFGVLALAIGAAGLSNAFLVMRLGMRKLASIALHAMVLLASAFIPVIVACQGQPPLLLFMLVLLLCFFCFGILFGNLNALALEPMGHLAGSAASVVGALSTALSIPLGVSVGQAYDASVLPLFLGMAILGGTALLLTRGILGGSDGASQ